MKKTHTLLLLVMAALLLLVGCKPDDPVVTFVEYEIEPGTWTWVEEWLNENENLELRLDLMGIYAIDSDMIFLFGNIMMNAGPLHSVLLRSDNGGENWHEVMPPENGSTIYQVDFLEDGQGWALVTWTMETLGGSKVFHTFDYGETWEEIGGPVGDVHMPPISLEMLDAQRGQIEFALLTGFPQLDGYYVDVTNDGGATWERESFISMEDNLEQLYEDISSRREAQKSHQAEDGSEWKLEQTDYGEPYHVMRRLSSDDEWTTTAVIPTDYVIRDGIISLAEESD